MSTVFWAHVVVIHPVTNYFLNIKNYPRPKGLYYALAFIFLASSVCVWHELQETEMSYYGYLGVGRSATSIELKRAQRHRSLELHPDKNPNNPNAESDMAKLNKIYEVLSNQVTREAYDRFGPEKVEWLKDKRNQAVDSSYDSQAMFGMGFFYLTWAVLSYFLTLGKSSAAGRTWLFGGLVLLAVLEFSMKFNDGDHFSFIQRFSIYEQIDILHKFFPAYLNACKSISQATFVDEDRQTAEMLAMVLRNQQALSEQLTVIMQQTDRKGKGGQAKAVDLNDKKNDPSIPLELRQNLAKAEEKMGKAPRLDPSNPNIQNMRDAKAQKEKGNSVMNFVWMICFYAFLNYVLK
mmetsp:Transcript_49818/g.97685  ORF Transcript_49818/g.97685 Transcript_49818/m.97685 type:complete len:349 (+) Transcript_49818:31-1077(+)